MAPPNVCRKCVGVPDCLRNLVDKWSYLAGARFLSSTSTAGDTSAGRKPTRKPMTRPPTYMFNIRPVGHWWKGMLPLPLTRIISHTAQRVPPGVVEYELLAAPSRRSICRRQYTELYTPRAWPLIPKYAGAKEEGNRRSSYRNRAMPCDRRRSTLGRLASQQVPFWERNWESGYISFSGVATGLLLLRGGASP